MTIPPCFICRESGRSLHAAAICRRYDHRELAILELLKATPQPRPAAKPFPRHIRADYTVPWKTLRKGWRKPPASFPAPEMVAGVRGW